MQIDRKHLLEYTVFFSVSVLFIAVLFRFHYHPQVVQQLIISISVFYPSWGIIHSALEGRLTKVTFFEYILFGTLVYLLLTIARSF